MKPLLFIGVVLVVLGIFALVTPDVRYVERKTIVKAGDINLEAKVPRTFHIPDQAAVLVIGIGAAMVVSSAVLAGKRR
jgi:hypothetical protein